MLLLESGIYLSVYLIVAICAVLDSLIKNKLVKLSLLMLSGVTIIAMITFRWNIGTDWDAYYQYFLANVGGGAIGSELDDHFDMGYKLLNASVALITSDYNIFLLVTTLSSTGIVCYLLWTHTPQPLIGLLVFICSYVPIHFIGSIRRSIALAVTLLSVFIWLKSKKRIVSYFSFLASTAFHKTSILAAPIFLLKPVPWSSPVVLLVLIGAAILGMINISEIILVNVGEAVPKNSEIGLVITLANYSGEYYKLHTPEGLDPFRLSILSLAKKYIFLCFVYLAIKKDVSPSNALIILCKTYVIGVVIYSVFIGAPIIQTIATYYLIFEIFIASLIFDKLSSLQRYLFVVYLIISGYFTFESGLTVYPELFFPYRSVF